MIPMGPQQQKQSDFVLQNTADDKIITLMMQREEKQHRKYRRKFTKKCKFARISLSVCVCVCVCVCV